MPNGGKICCYECAYNRVPDMVCEVFGTEASPGFLCRFFRMHQQSHEDARLHWPMLLRLEPGVVYAIDNGAVWEDLNPRPAYRVARVDPGC